MSEDRSCGRSPWYRLGTVARRDQAVWDFLDDGRWQDLRDWIFVLAQGGSAAEGSWVWLSVAAPAQAGPLKSWAGLLDAWEAALDKRAEQRRGLERLLRAAESWAEGLRAETACLEGLVTRGDLESASHAWRRFATRNREHSPGLFCALEEAISCHRGAADDEGAGFQARFCAACSATQGIVWCVPGSEAVALWVWLRDRSAGLGETAAAWVEDCGALEVALRWVAERVRSAACEARRCRAALRFGLENRSDGGVTALASVTGDLAWHEEEDRRDDWLVGAMAEGLLDLAASRTLARASAVAEKIAGDFQLGHVFAEALVSRDCGLTAAYPPVPAPPPSFPPPPPPHPCSPDGLGTRPACKLSENNFQTVYESVQNSPPEIFHQTLSLSWERRENSENAAQAPTLPWPAEKRNPRGGAGDRGESRESPPPPRRLRRGGIGRQTLHRSEARAARPARCAYAK